MRLSFDYIVVGAGSAGCVLANRLSANPSTRVLLLEAGPKNRAKEIHIPAGFTKLFKGELDWAFETEPEPGCKDRRLFWPRGKVLGGSSSMNAMLYIRGHRADYDRWQGTYGCGGWAFDEVLPYFLRSENQSRGGNAFHGVGGPLHVGDRRYTNPLSHQFVAAGRELGWPDNPDFNGESQEGIGLYQVTQKRGRRWSSADAFLSPALGRKNLTVLTQTPANRLEIEGGKAIGVRATHKGKEHRFEASTEVLLCGGAVSSPHLLLLSGVGPPEHLRSFDIPVKAPLPGVGANLQDHVIASTVYRSREDLGLDNAETLANLARYFLLRRGPLATSVCEGAAFVRTSPHLPQPDLQFHFLPAALVDHGFDSAADQGFNMGPTLIKPQSRGRISLRSKDPSVAPKIEARYFEHPDDLPVLVKGVELARSLAATREMVDLIDVEAWPGPGVQTQNELADFVRRVAATLYHPACTCAMGPASGGPLETVVGPDLRVHGVANLRVVDASIMPEVIGGNTNAPTIMIGEKAADLILGR